MNKVLLVTKTLINFNQPDTIIEKNNKQAFTFTNSGKSRRCSESNGVVSLFK